MNLLTLLIELYRIEILQGNNYSSHRRLLIELYRIEIKPRRTRQAAGNAFNRTL